MYRHLIDLSRVGSILGAVVFLLSSSAQAAPLGIFPGSTGLKEAKALLGEPEETLIAEVRYRFKPPSGSGFSRVELYIGRKSGVVEIAEFYYETPPEPNSVRASLGRKAADLSYPQVAGGTREVFLAPRVSLLLGADGKVRAISYLSGEALGLILADLAPLKADRSTPEKALLSLVAAFTAGRESALKEAVGSLISTDEVRALLKRREALLLLFDGFHAEFPRSKGKKEITVRLRQPLYGTAEFTFQQQGSEWLFSGLKLLEEGAPTSPRGAFESWRDALLADGGGLSGASVEALWGASWRDLLPRMELVGGWLTESKGASGAVLLISAPQDKKLVLLLERDGKNWRVAEVKGRNP